MCGTRSEEFERGEYKMSLTRYLPLPSDRMGIIWNLLNIKEGVVLEYGPAGTTHFSMSLYGELGVDAPERLFTTHIGEEDIVMGDTTRLEKALLEIDEAYSPKVIFVVASSITSIIGTDLKGICNYMQKRVNAHLIPVEQGGFRGDYSVGIQFVQSLLAEEFPKRRETEPKTYNLLGVSLGSYRMRSDIVEIQDLLEKAFGWKRKTCFCYDTSVQQIEDSGNAKINIVLRPEAVEAAKIMKKNCDIPWVLGTPYGYLGTLLWIEKIANIIKEEPDPEFLMQIKEKERNSSMYQMNVRMLKRDVPKVSLVGEYHVIEGLASFFQKIWLTVANKICLHSLKAIPDADKTILYLSEEKEKKKILETIHNQLVFADDISIEMCSKDNIFFRISASVVRGAEVANHLPIAGVRGTDMILEVVEQYFQILR